MIRVDPATGIEYTRGNGFWAWEDGLVWANCEGDCGYDCLAIIARLATVNSSSVSELVSRATAELKRQAEEGNADIMTMQDCLHGLIEVVHSQAAENATLRGQLSAVRTFSEKISAEAILPSYNRQDSRWMRAVGTSLMKLISADAEASK